ncbi:MAG: PP2C family serine/threonine-protein phosphatase [Ktedonobacterales bacterium]
MSLRLSAAAKTDVGKQREQNEDACYTQIVEDERRATGLFIVSDGMGGYHAGEIASQLAVDTIRDELQSLFGPASTQPTVRLNTRRRKRGKGEREDPAKTRPLSAEAEENTEEQAEAREAHPTQLLGESLVLEHYAEKLRDAVEHSSGVIVKYGKTHSDAKGLGATLTAALVIDGQAFIANVGDSRTYLLRDGKLERITRDHSLVERLVEAGQIDREDVYDHPSRNLIYRSLGAGHAEVDVDIFTEQLQPGDALLLCCDGLWEMIRDPEIESILNDTPDGAQACDKLIALANENGGEDNITAVLVRCIAG